MVCKSLLYIHTHLCMCVRISSSSSSSILWSIYSFVQLEDEFREDAWDSIRQTNGNQNYLDSWNEAQIEVGTSNTYVRTLFCHFIMPIWMVILLKLFSQLKYWSIHQTIEIYIYFCSVSIYCTVMCIFKPGSWNHWYW